MGDKGMLLLETTELLNNADEKTMRMVYAMLSINESDPKNDWWDEMDTVQEQRLEASIKQPDNGELFPHSEAEKIMQKWS